MQLVHVGAPAGQRGAEPAQPVEVEGLQVREGRVGPRLERHGDDQAPARDPAEVPERRGGRLGGQVLEHVERRDRVERAVRKR